MHPIAKLIVKASGVTERKPRVYLAVPYSTNGMVNDTWRTVRFDLVNIAAMRLIRAGFIVFSPISHSHPLSLTQVEKFNTHDLWLEQDMAFMEWADLLVVLVLPGTSESRGVQCERAWFKQRKKPVFDLTISDIYKLEKHEETV